MKWSIKKIFGKNSVFATFFLVNIVLGVFALAGLKSATEVKAHLYAGYSVLDHLTPVPGGRKFPCDQIVDYEFHSLRPYQASPCGDSPKAT